MFASDRLGSRFYGSGFGIRVVVQVRPDGHGKSEAHITGMTAAIPFGVYERGIWMRDFADRAQADEYLGRLVVGETGEVKHEIEAMLGFQRDSVSIRGMRVYQVAGEPDWRVERRGTGTGKASTGHDISYSFVVAGTPTEAGAVISKAPLLADAAGEARVFPIDPTSQDKPDKLRRRRPTRTEKELNAFRKDRQITVGQRDPLILEGPRGHELMQVIVCPRFVREDRAAPGPAKSVDLPGGGPPIRSNDFSAVSAFNNVRQLFDRLIAYGLRPHDYFRIASLPLKVAYRSGVWPGPGKDGETVNARVHVTGWKGDFMGPAQPGERPSVEMHLALGNLSHRARKRWDRKNRSPAEPLGMAADVRWIWHEIGHVLLMASVGELEFRFAHSAGDALAAIASDPESKLAAPPTIAALRAAHAKWRGATFPSAFLPRRHDRCVLCGWSWSGSMHRAMARVPNSLATRRKGYQSEQILSSSLFRLYLSLGGDTIKAGSADPQVRETASHYSVYLIMRAIQMLGTGGIVLANDPDQFVAALIEADVGTGAWNVDFPPPAGTTFPPPPAGPPHIYSRIGGCAHKVIRWAFEAQGLYAKPGTLTNAPGQPPPVDIYIEDGRPGDVDSPYGAITYGPGNYAPVSLHWDRKQTGASPEPPAWQSPVAIVVNGNDIQVTVGNRGTEPATNVNVSVFFRRWPAERKPPAWKQGAGWTPCNPQPSPGQTIAPGALATFAFTHVPPGRRYLVLAQATCDDDRANTDPATGLPCSQLETPLIDLVAGDNNLGLRVVR
jgi:hypothetical protein